ncbi:MAG: hypothetical protein KAT68_14380 [Bacteroidales bacterium]|nr:hypothetical protein [Bacteroidales bacterium]
MIKLKILIFLIILIFFSINNYAQQIKKFTPDSAAFFEELEIFMDKSDKKKESKELIEKFALFWSSGKLSDDHIQRIYNTSNILLKKRARNYPHFYDYINILMEFHETDNNLKNYDSWEEALNNICQNKKITLSKILKYLNFTKYLLHDNTIYKSSTLRWAADNKNYKLTFDETVKLTFDKVNITCYVKKDSINIYNTQGSFYPLETIWKGQDGMVFWDKSGLSKDSVFTKLSKYQINMTKSYYEADSVLFTNKNYFNYSLHGKLKDKVMIITTPQRTTYPRFESYQTRFEIKDIFKNIDYLGGFTMRGIKFIGTGSDVEDAYLFLYRKVEIEKNNEIIIEDKLFLKAASKFFVFRLDNIIGKNSAISMYLDQDSIFHPGLLLKYIDETREVNLIRDDDPESRSKSPYYNTYHNIDMDFELLRWKIDDPNIDFTMLRGSAINQATFESFNFFSASRYYKFQGMDDVHIYIILRNFAKKYDTEEFTGLELADYMKKSLHSVRQMLIRLSYMGIVDYFSTIDIVRIKQRLYDYLDAVVGEKDYDVLDFISNTDAPLNNATLNLKNFDLQIFGIPEIHVSDSQNVVFYPKGQKILLKKDRNFDFEGVVNAGLFTFFGQNFTFKYDSFKVDLNEIDSLRLRVKAGVDNWGQRKLENVRSVIESVTGELLIDDPNNKSGVKDIPQYPIFYSNKDSYIYYDKTYIQKGVYKKDDFYFKLDPYTIDSLNNFSTEGMGYDGTLYSSGIFPEFTEMVVLQEDNSLGFVHKTPENGFPIFGGKGNYNNDIALSNRGLRGDGILTYLTSTTYSDDFIFFPDSMNTLAQKFINDKKMKGVKYPSVEGEDIKIHWEPYEDELLASNVKEPMIIFDKQGYINGEIKLEPTEMTANGSIHIEDSRLKSDLFKFSDETIDSKYTKFDIRTTDLTEFTFRSDSVKSHIDFVKKNASFKSNKEVTQIQLPQNQYHAYIESFTWEMDEEKISMSTEYMVKIIESGVEKYVPKERKGNIPIGSQFISVHPKQDSLNFISPESEYDLKDYILFSRKVKYIKVADATVYPGDGDVTVEKKAKMRTLINASILASNTTKYHKFYNASVNIHGAKKYSGSGNYTYTDENNKEQEIYFNLIAVDTSIQTFASGKIIESQNFTLNPQFPYFGNVKLSAENIYLTFDGQVKIIHECYKTPMRWVKFTTEINPKQIFIPISKNPVNQNNTDLYTGIMFHIDSTHVFSTFLSSKKRHSDKYIVTADGYLFFDKNSKKYTISNKKKLMDFDTTGNFISIHRTFCNIYGEGKLDLRTKLGQVKLETVGNANHNMKKDEISFDLIMAIDFFFDERAINIIGDTLAQNPNLTAINVKRQAYTKGLAELIDPQLADALIQEASLFGTYKKFPKELEHTILLTDLKLKWNTETSSYRSTGKIGIGSIMKTQINKFVDGYLEIETKRSGHSFGLYLEIDKNNWYFFYYKRGLMQAYSSNAEFNTIVHDLKASKRKMEVARGEESYLFFLSNERKRREFLRRFIDDDKEEDDYDGEFGG